MLPLLLFLTATLAAQIPDPTRFEGQIEAYEQQDARREVPPNEAVLFVGSSSFRLWKGLEESFPHHYALNRGFGGSNFNDLLHYADRLIYPYRPRAVFVYEGDNDLAHGFTPDEILTNAGRLRDSIAHHLGDSVPVVFVAPKPSLARWEMHERYVEVNRRLADYAAGRDATYFADVWTPALADDGEVMDDIFIADGLHLNDKGYRIWQRVLQPLMDNLVAVHWQERVWPASWISSPSAPASDFTVVDFRREFQIDELPDSLPVMVSADNRYQLFVNGERIGMGPARSDRLHWRYEKYDIAPHLRSGANEITATVWNYGIHRPWAQESYRTAFVLQPCTTVHADLRTDEQWTTRVNEAYSPVTGVHKRLGTYIVVGPQLRIDGAAFPWSETDYPFTEQAIILHRASPRGTSTEMYWPLVPRQIPAMELRELPDLLGDTLLPANTRDSFLLDVGHLTNAFFKLNVSGGEGARIRVTYAESLFEAGTNDKGHRDSTAGKVMRGVYDEYLPAGGNDRIYTTLWFRTARYVQIDYETAAEPLRIGGIEVEEFAYPFTEVGGFTTTQSERRIDDILEVGWRTARLCAQETYVDCPYYEQLQYVGDTRIQALISLYVSGDARLMRKAIELFDQSRMAEGLTMSRYPDHTGQVIPPYSLMWVMMVYDYMLHVDDPDFVRERLDGVRAILDWYHRQELPNGLIGQTPYWNYVDWTPQWRWDPVRRMGGVPRLAGGSSIISGQYAMALGAAAEVFASLDMAQDATAYRQRAAAVTTAVREHCWDEARGLLADTPVREVFSQHANIMGILNDGLPVPKEEILMRILEDSTLIQSSAYFDFYLAEALRKAGKASMYPEFLDQWRGYLDQGFTTFPEKPGWTRSDCHAWSASPNYHLPSLLAGIRPGAPGFAEVIVAPAEVSGFPFVAEVPTPRGLVRVESDGGRQPTYTINLPAGVTGRFVGWGKEVALHAGANSVR